ncbi:MAG: glutamate--cysteine ligase [Planctomycetaceae bacterium]|nr:glutamate--cysteine ligase [Planctomycetaceae bacterium]
MGQEIAAAHFRYHDFHRFDRLLREELALLQGWFQDRNFSSQRSIAGLELETWLVGPTGDPLPINEQVLALVDSPDVVPELSRFNIEFNVAPQSLAARGPKAMVSELDATWAACDRIAGRLGAGVVSIGILPTITDALLSLSNMSSPKRYQALNEQVLRLRQGRPIRLDIEGREHLKTEHHDVMLESGTTSLQLHLQVPLDEAVRFYNAAVILSAPLVAVSANSPLLFGKLLWEESRIPLFEQAVDVGGGRFSRVTFGSEYAQDSLEEFFVENQDHYPVMLPLSMDERSDRLVHLRLHNGTIWRWNRPLIGFDSDGRPHLRVEQRVMAAGPTTADMAANMALYYGLAESLATAPHAPESRLSFADARHNFYHAARHGLDATAAWFDGRQWPLRKLLLTELLPLARDGLERLHVDSDLIDQGLSIIESRVATGLTGAAWQRRFVERHGRDLALLTREYHARQRTGQPVHTLDV